MSAPPRRAHDGLQLRTPRSPRAPGSASCTPPQSCRERAWCVRAPDMSIADRAALEAAGPKCPNCGRGHLGLCVKAVDAGAGWLCSSSTGKPAWPEQAFQGCGPSSGGRARAGSLSEAARSGVSPRAHAARSAACSALSGTHGAGSGSALGREFLTSDERAHGAEPVGCVAALVRGRRRPRTGRPRVPATRCPRRRRQSSVPSWSGTPISDAGVVVAA